MKKSLTLAALKVVPHTKQRVVYEYVPLIIVDIADIHLLSSLVSLSYLFFIHEISLRNLVLEKARNNMQPLSKALLGELELQ